MGTLHLVPQSFAERNWDIGISLQLILSGIPQARFIFLVCLGNLLSVGELTRRFDDGINYIICDE